MNKIPFKINKTTITLDIPIKMLKLTNKDSLYIDLNNNIVEISKSPIKTSLPAFSHSLECFEKIKD